MDELRSDGGDERLGIVERLAPLGLLMALTWLVEVVDRVLPANLEAHGIRPRHLSGLDGVAWAPLLHAGWGHLVANTGPLLILGVLVLLRGLGRWVTVTAFVWVVGGLITWLIGSSGVHLGASGLVFGYFGALLGAAVFERSVRAAAPALVALMLYSTLVFGLVPRAGLSWEGHLAGLVAGLVVARLTARGHRRDQPNRLMAN